MNIICHRIGMIKNNCYVVTDEKAIIIIDPTEFTAEIKADIDNNKGKECFVLLTHGHFDHICGVADIKDYCNATVVIHEDDKQGLSDESVSLATKFHAVQRPVIADITVKDGDKLNLCGIEVTVIHTKGHTKGSVCYVMGNSIFTGDTLFCNSIGRYDFPGGDFHELMDSIKKLVDLPGDYDLYPGHMEQTTLQYQRENNPYIVGRLL